MKPTLVELAAGVWSARPARCSCRVAAHATTRWSRSLPARSPYRRALPVSSPVSWGSPVGPDAPVAVIIPDLSPCAARDHGDGYGTKAEAISWVGLHCARYHEKAAKARNLA